MEETILNITNEILGMVLGFDYQDHRDFYEVNDKGLITISRNYLILFRDIPIKQLRDKIELRVRRFISPQGRLIIFKGKDFITFEYYSDDVWVMCHKTNLPELRTCSE